MTYQNRSHFGWPGDRRFNIVEFRIELCYRWRGGVYCKSATRELVCNASVCLFVMGLILGEQRMAEQNWQNFQLMTVVTTESPKAIGYGLEQRLSNKQFDTE